MQLLNNKLVQTVFIATGTILLFGLIGYMFFIHAFPVEQDEEQRIKQFEQVRKDRAEYYGEHPHKELNAHSRLILIYIQIHTNIKKHQLVKASAC
ncbi:hypothetical protein LRO89_02905 [Priestia megaterium]|uniref:hypothetical protein n=1 Tax=Priestia megaterium TaxID=1404 RepID=UPI0039C439B5